jgi:Phage Mu protein F like protein/Contact-dependent growth inhibition CdiA C-terminal domain
MCTICDNQYIFSTKQRIQLSKELNIDTLVQEAINQLYNDRQIDKPTQQALLQSHYEPLKQAVNEGFGNSLSSIQYGTPNYEFLKQLQTNTATFAAFKNHASIKAMTALLKDSGGNLRTREDFKNEALKIDSTYRTTYLDAEYDTAVRTARLAAQWQKFEKNKRIYPNLKYLLTKSSQPDKTHLKYVGIIAPIDSPFWNTHYPPNRWRCQCGVEPTDEDTTDIPDNLPPVPAEFAFNAGKLGQVFDLKNSSHIKSVQPKEQPALIKAAQAMVNKEAAAVAPYQTLYTSKSGTVVEAHPLAFNNGDFQQNLKVARNLANSSLDIKTIQILPEVKDPALRKELLPDVKEAKNPDFRIDGSIYDAKQPSGDKPGSRTIKNLMSDAEKQAEGSVLVIPDNYVAEKTLYDMIGNQFRLEKYKDYKLYLNYDGNWQYFDQKSWLDFYKSIKKSPR